MNAKEQPLISVIVPVYKVEKYLPACLDSLLAQTYQNFEHGTGGQVPPMGFHHSGNRH